jgi:hypothetical protein
MLAQSVRQQWAMSFAIVQPTPAHRDQLRLHAREDAGVRQGSESPRRQCEIDRTAALGRTHARIGPPLEQAHAMPIGCKQQ